MFTTDGAYAQVKAGNLKNVISENEDVLQFKKEYRDTFVDLKDMLSNILIDGAETLSVVKTEEQLVSDLLQRFEHISLVDKYEAYEIFYTGYEKISGDLEIIQAEGIASVRQVDPNMVVKKKNGNDTEVQEGWKGHLLPFELVQKSLLSDEVQSLDNKKSELQEIPSELDSILEELTEEEKETISDALNDTNDAFVVKNVAVVIKSLKQEKTKEANSLILKLQRVTNLNKEEKQLKSEIKIAEEDLHLKTKEVIENLSEENVRELLQLKWITPICDELMRLPYSCVDKLQKSINALSKKYEDTYANIENEIQEAEASLCEMMSELTGSEADMAAIREFQKLLGGKF